MIKKVYEHMWNEYEALIAIRVDRHISYEYGKFAIEYLLTPHRLYDDDDD